MINATVLAILHDPVTQHNAHLPPTTLGQETAQVLLLECNETVVAQQVGVYPDTVAALLTKTLQLKNATVIAGLEAYGSACPREGDGLYALTVQRGFVDDFLLDYTFAVVTCNSVWYLTSWATASPTSSAAAVSWRYELLVNGSRAATPIYDTLLVYSAFGVGHATGALPRPPP